jgi:hypothetical protein
MAPYFGNVLQHQPNVIVNLNLHRSQGVGMGGFLHVPIECGKDLTPISRHKTLLLFSRRDIHRQKGALQIPKAIFPIAFTFLK